MSRLASALAALSFCSLVLVVSCQVPGTGTHPPAGQHGDGLGTAAWRDRVMTSRFCGECHPDAYAEHAQNTHGRAFTDPEVRLATGNFEHGDCIRCHTPRPIFETGIGQNPQRRFTNLEEGNTCMTCHWQQGVDYARFQGGADCKTAFDPRVGTVEACATCHRNHGTPYQWELAPNGKGAGRTCTDCHMREVERPIAVGGPVRKTHSHAFPGARNDAHVGRAYGYATKIDGNEAVVTITNKGAGHNFPTELKQRAVESLVIVRDQDGKEIARSRLVFRDPYKRPYGLHLQVNTQIPSGESREHRVPIGIANGSVECQLHYKFYYPIEDDHPDLSRRLETISLPFTGLTPSAKPVVSEPEVKVVTPEGIDARIASVADLVDFARPPIGKTQVEVPTGSTPADIKQLIDLFMFPVPQANREAIAALTKIGMPAVPALIEALGSWDNKTFNAAIQTLTNLGAPAVPAVRSALASDQLYVRLHARQLLASLPVPADKDALVAEVARGLALPNALDRASACQLLARLGAASTAPALRERLRDDDPDVVRAAGLALASLGDRSAVAAIEQALAAANFDELRIDLGFALARLGAGSGVRVLLTHLDHQDDLIREGCFEKFFAVTQQHFGYEPMAPAEERLAAIARLEAWWTTARPADALRQPHRVAPLTDDKAFNKVMAMGGGAGVIPAAENDTATINELVAMGKDALPALIKGLKFPPGFAAKRASILAALGRIGDPAAAPFVAATLRDPVFGVAAYAAQALETCGDRECVPALRRYEARLRTAAATKARPASIPSIDPLLAGAARARLLLGDDGARRELVNLLTSADEAARTAAIATLKQHFGDDRGFDPKADAGARLAAAARWMK